MTINPTQLTLDLPYREAMGREDFFLAPSNAAAVRMIEAWPGWPSRHMALVGPAGSGKTHLAQVWRAKSGAQMVKGHALALERAPDLLRSGALVIERDEMLDERGLFHIINLAREQEAFLLLLSNDNPDRWGIGLPDLATRLKTFARIAIGAPDDVLLRAVMVKHFTDRQIAVDEQVIDYLLARIPRSLETVRKIVAEADKRALAERAEINRVFVSRLLRDYATRNYFNEGDEAEQGA